MDEQPVQLLKESRQPIPATKGQPRRVDYEYERAGTATTLHSLKPSIAPKTALYSSLSE
jgi:hypothetical protein